jgi:hypothetical protein
MTDGSEPVNSIVAGQWLGHDGAMKIMNISLIGIALALGACEPMSLFHRPGVSVAQMQSDSTECEVQALRDAPVASQMRQNPPVFIPGNTFCNADGQCRTSPGTWIPGAYSTVDVNADLRSRVMQQCMAKRGYQPVTLRDCSSGIRAAVTPAQTTILPKLTETSCVIRHDGGAWQIVTQAG